MPLSKVGIETKFLDLVRVADNFVQIEDRSSKLRHLNWGERKKELENVYSEFPDLRRYELKQNQNKAVFFRVSLSNSTRYSAGNYGIPCSPPSCRAVVVADHLFDVCYGGFL